MARFVGYLEEQAVVTYSDILDKMDEGKLPMWSNLPAPEIAAKYWKLGEKAMMRDVILAIRYTMVHLTNIYNSFLGLTRHIIEWSTIRWGIWILNRRTHLVQESRTLVIITFFNII